MAEYETHDHDVLIIGAESLSSSNTVFVAVRASIWCCAKYATRTFEPSSRVPASNGSTPARIFSRVDFPAPFGPMSATRCPRSNWRSRSPS